MKPFKKFALATLAAVAFGHALADEMVISTEVPVTHWKGRYTNEYADCVTKRTNGKLAVKVFPAGQLYTDKDALSNLGTGSVHMVWPISSLVELLEPKAGLLGVPFLITDELMLKPAFAKGLAQLASDNFEKRNMQILGLLRATDGILVFKDKVVRKPSDLKGVKLRLPPGGKDRRDAYVAMGASPVALPASEMAPALAQGVIDGIATSPAAWRTIVGDTAKQGMTIPGMSIATYAVTVDKKWLAARPADQRQAIEGCLADTTSGQWKESIAEDEAEIKKMVAGGATFWRANEAETKPWHEAMQPAIDAFDKRYPGLMAKYQQLVKQDGN